MNPEANPLFLITGATGKQGGAAIRHLIKSGASIRALTRKPEGDRAKALRKMGVEVVKGNLKDKASLDAATQGVTGLFAVTNFWEIGTGKKEVIQNKNLTDAAQKNGVKHYVFASVARCDDNPNLAHFMTKHECEQYVIASGIPYTFLRPVYFMDNLRPGAQGATFHWAVLPEILGDKTSLQMIATSDIGWFAAEALLHPERYLNQTLDLAGDEVTWPQILKAYTKVFQNAPAKSGMMKFFLMTFFPEIRKMMHWYREPRFKADIAALKSMHPGMMNLEEFFKQIKSGK